MTAQLNQCSNAGSGTPGEVDVSRATLAEGGGTGRRGVVVPQSWTPPAFTRKLGSADHCHASIVARRFVGCGASCSVFEAGVIYACW